MENSKDFIEFEYGNVPLIFSVPHGGAIESKNIPKRSSGVMGIDKTTIELAKELISYINLKTERLTSVKETLSYVFSKIRRSQIDLNRTKNEAFNSNSVLAAEIYDLYHRKIREFINMNLKKFNYSLLVDIHGFEKNKRPQGFRDVEIVLGTDNLNSLFPEPVPKKEWDRNIRGKLIDRFLEQNIPIAPSDSKRKEYILTGGFIVQEYGASKLKGSQTIQIEFSDEIRINNENLKKKVIHSISEVLLNHILSV
jgi:N-formylglutamate amidohydrolase